MAGDSRSQKYLCGPVAALRQMLRKGKKPPDAAGGGDFR